MSEEELIGFLAGTLEAITEVYDTTTNANKIAWKGVNAYKKFKEERKAAKP